MDGCTRQNPAYRPATGGAPARGLLPFLLVLAMAAVGTAGGNRAGAIAHQALDAKPKSWKPDVKRARKYAKRRASDVRFSIVDVEGRRYGFHPGRTAPMASTIKVMLLAVYLRRGAVRDRQLHSRDRELLGPMIRRSDNDAATTV